MDNSKPICPPVPSREKLEEGLKSGYYEEIDLNNAKENDIIIMDSHPFPSYINNKKRYLTCIEIVNPKNNKGDPIDWITIRFLSNKEVNRIPFRISKNYLAEANVKFYKINERLDFDKVINQKLETIHEYPIDRQLTIFEKVMATPGLPDEIGKYLSTKPSKKKTPKGGNRKNRKTKKNKKQNKSNKKQNKK